MSMSKLTGALKAAQQRTATIPPAPTGGFYPLDQIKLRHQDTRPLNEIHVAALAESIGVLGLIEPVAIDAKGQLLAGGHRLAAIKQIQANEPETFQKQFPGGAIPARVFPFNADQEPELALQIEIAENEKRRDYSSSEVRDIADRLRNMGFSDVQGRPRKEQKALMPALSVVVGRSIRRVRQLMNQEDETQASLAGAGSESGSDESRKRFLLLQTALRSLEKWEKLRGETTLEKELAAKLPNVVPLLKQMIDSH
jgi:ParB family transcriptional regulator, chromosome partitioning protein